jgi:1,2-diacylglycerol 3-alpha-glucosyltransferase
MRILQVTPGYYPQVGGVEAHVRAISERLVAIGHEVVVATVFPDGGAPLAESIGGVLVHRCACIRVGGIDGISTGLLGYLRHESRHFDVLHVHNYHSAVVPLAAAVRHRCMVATPHLNEHAHSDLAQVLHVLYMPLGRWSLSQARAVVCVSTSEQDRVVSRLHVPREKAVVVPNGVDPASQASTTSSRDDHLLLCVGRLQAYKRIDRVIAALAALPEMYRLVIVGAGPARSALERQAAACGVGERCLFTGQISDDALADWYRKAEVMIHLSSAEAFGFTIFEAIAAGCKVVCSDISAFREASARFPGWVSVVMDEGQTAVASAIQQAAQSRAGGTVDLADLGWDTAVTRLLALYHRLLDIRDGSTAPASHADPKDRSVNDATPSSVGGPRGRCRTGDERSAG